MSCTGFLVNWNNNWRLWLERINRKGRRQGNTVIFFVRLSCRGLRGYPVLVDVSDGSERYPSLLLRHFEIQPNFETVIFSETYDRGNNPNVASLSMHIRLVFNISQFWSHTHTLTGALHFHSLSMKCLHRSIYKWNSEKYAISLLHSICNQWFPLVRFGFCVHQNPLTYTLLQQHPNPALETMVKLSKYPFSFLFSFFLSFD